MSQELHLACCQGSRYAIAKTLCLRFYFLDLSLFSVATGGVLVKNFPFKIAVL